MEPQRKLLQLNRVFPIGEEDDEDDNDNLSLSHSFDNASDLSYDCEDLNLDSLLPLNSAVTMETVIVEEDATEFIQAASEQIADVECELADSLVLSENDVMQVTAVETRTCWPLQMVQSSSATVLLRAPPGRRYTAAAITTTASSGNSAAMAAAPPDIDLLALLTQPKIVPHNPEMHTVELRHPNQSSLSQPRQTVLSSIHRLADAALSAAGLQFHPIILPPMSRCEKVPYLHGFSFGDTYQVEEKLWLLPQLMCGALALTGILLTLVGTIMLQIHKYLVTLCKSQSEDLKECRMDEESITSVTMSIGVGTIGGGLTMIVICAIVFLHAFCVIYDEGEHHKTKNLENVSLHVPTAAYRVNLSDLHPNSAVQPQQQADEQQNREKTESVKPPLVRWQSHYDNLNVTDSV